MQTPGDAIYAVEAWTVHKRSVTVWRNGLLWHFSWIHEPELYGTVSGARGLCSYFSRSGLRSLPRMAHEDTRTTQGKLRRTRSLSGTGHGCPLPLTRSLRTDKCIFDVPSANAAEQGENTAHAKGASTMPHPCILVFITPHQSDSGGKPEATTHRE